MKLPWLKRIGILFLPSTYVGWTILLTGLAYAIYVFIDIDSRSHSASDTLRNYVFHLLIIGVVYTIIAAFTNRTSEKIH